MGLHSVKKSRNTRFWVLFCGGTLLASITVLWVRGDNAIAPPTDSAHHLLNAIHYSRVLTEVGPRAYLETIRTTYVGWPPASYALLYGPLAALLGDSPPRLRSASVALIPLLLLLSYALGRRLLGPRHGTLAALLTLFSLGIAGQLRQVSVDLPAAVAVLFALWALDRGDAFAGPRRAALVGLALGLCLLTRVQAAFFVAGPTLFLAGWALVTARGERPRRLAWIALAAAVALFVSAPWWWGRLHTLLFISSSHLDPSRIKPRGDPRFLPGLLYYLRALGGLAGWPLLLLCVGGLVARLQPSPSRRRPRRGGPRPISGRDLALLLLCVGGGVLGCTAGVHREPRYLLPAVPVVVLLAVEALRLLPRARWRELVGVAALVLGVVPTLAVNLWPLQGRSPLVRAGLVEWAYVRGQRQMPTEALAAAAAARLLRFNGGDRTGEDTYIILAQDSRYNLLPRVAAYLSAHFPRLVFCSTVNRIQANLPWHQRLRRRRRLFVLAGLPQRLSLPEVWSSGPGKRPFHIRVPLRLYRVPSPHPLRGRITVAGLQ